MKKFYQLIKDAKSKSYARKFVGFCSSPTFTKYLSDIYDVDAFVAIHHPDMLCLKNISTGNEVYIYESSFVDYSIDYTRNCFVIQCKNKPDVCIEF